MTDNIVAVAFGRPPTDHARGRRRACGNRQCEWVLVRASLIITGSNLKRVDADVAGVRRCRKRHRPVAVVGRGDKGGKAGSGQCWGRKTGGGNKKSVGKSRRENRVIRTREYGLGI